MKKVLFVHHTGTIGGAGISGLNVINSLNKLRYDVTVYCSSNDSGGMNELFRENGFKVESGGNSPKIIFHFSGSQHFLFSPFFLKCIYDVFKDVSNIKKAIKDVNPDIVVMNSMTLFWIALVAKKLNKETILFFRETYTKGFLGIRTFFIKSLISKYVDKVAFISNYENNKSEKLKSFKTTIYNALDEGKFNSLDISDCRNSLKFSSDIFYILYLGGMTAYKGAEVAIDAIRYIKNPNIKLIFVGYDWNGSLVKLSDKKGILRKIKFLLGFNYESNVIKKIVNYELKNRIQFYPNQKKIGTFFKACDCIVLPITKPHQARPLFEAGFAKIPVVITDFPQIRELCDETNSYLFDNKNSKMLAERIMQIINFREDAHIKVENNYKRVVERHSFSNFKIQINKLFQNQPCKP